MKSFLRSVIIIFIILSIHPQDLKCQDSLTISKITDNLYRFNVIAGYEVNLVVSIGEDGTLLVDAGFNSTARDVLEKIRSLGGNLPKYLINTHAHVDHTGGNILLAKEAKVIAHDILRNRLHEKGYVFEDYPDYALPEITFTDSMSLYFNDEKIKIYSINGSHSDNDAIVLFTKSKVAVMGDICYGMHYPSYDDFSGNVLNYPNAAQKAIDIVPDDYTLISGHGRECSMEEFKEFYTMFRQSINLVKARLENGISVETIQKDSLLKKWDSYSLYGYTTTDDWIQSIDYCMKDDRPVKSVAEPVYMAFKEDGLEAALKVYQEIKDSDSKEYNLSTGTSYGLGYKFWKKKLYDEALAFYSLQLKEAPDWKWRWYLHQIMGDIYLETGEKVKALKHFKKSVELDSEHSKSQEKIDKIESEEKQ